MKLRDYLPLELYGKDQAKSIESLEAEINSGECSIVWEDNKPIREVDVVKVQVVAHPEFMDNATLYEHEQRFKDGRVRNRNIEGLSEKLNFAEDPLDGAYRALKEELGIESDVDVVFDSHEFVETMESPSYPGLLSRYKIHNFTAYLPLAECKEEYVEVGKDKTTVFSWR